MAKLKSYGDILDRFSELPDSLILEILSLLETRDVVRTTILSKRWKNLWTTVPCLEFSECGRDSVQICNFVSRALTLWRGTHLRKFSIYFRRVSYKGAASLSTAIDSWVLFAKERKVEELYMSFTFGGLLYCPPQCLYECSSIRKLKLVGCNLQIRGNVQWHRLNSFIMFACCFPEDLIDKVLSSSPQLETFALCYIDEGQNLSIRSSSLKRLCVSSTNDESSVLTIWAPNLKALTLVEEPYGKYVLTDVSSLTEVYLGFWGKSCAVCQIFPAIQHVAAVKLSDDCIKMLGGRKCKYSFPQLLNAKLLTITNGLNEPSELVAILKKFPKLKMLIINWTNDYLGEVFKFNAKNYPMSEAKNLQSTLSELRTAQITWYSYEASIFRFIEFLLKHATMIERIVIQKGKCKEVKLGDMFLAAQKVESLQRSFPSVELVLCQE